jgi:hypothetical protein
MKMTRTALLPVSHRNAMPGLEVEGTRHVGALKRAVAKGPCTLPAPLGEQSPARLRTVPGAGAMQQGRAEGREHQVARGREAPINHIHLAVFFAHTGDGLQTVESSVRHNHQGGAVDLQGGGSVGRCELSTKAIPVPVASNAARVVDDVAHGGGRCKRTFDVCAYATDGGPHKQG